MDDPELTEAEMQASDSYRRAYIEFDASGDEAAWDGTAGDGLTDEPQR